MSKKKTKNPRPPEVDVVGQALAVLADPKSKKKDRREAEAYLKVEADRTDPFGSLPDAPTEGVSEPAEVDDEKLKAKVKAKKTLRAWARVIDRAASGKDQSRADIDDLTPDCIPRGDHELVTAWNLVCGVETGHFITSTAEQAKHSVEYPNPAESIARIVSGDQVTEEVETDAGREFVVGAQVEDGPEVVVEATPEEPALAGPAPEVERDWLGRPKIEYIDIATGKVKSKGYTRVTTYIDCLEDKSMLDKWKLRTLLEGAAIDWRTVMSDSSKRADDEDAAVSKVVTILHHHERALKKIDKRAKKGELDLGQFGLLKAEADKDKKTALDELAATLLDVGGAHDKALKGTDLHAWTERYDLSGQTIHEFVQSHRAATGLDPVTEADLRAYADKMTELGIEVVDTEQFVVLDDLGVAGTYDRSVMYKPKGGQRRVRVVADLKTGRVDYGPGKIGMQLGLYAKGMLYDHTKPFAERRSKNNVNQSLGLLIHLPAGEARCEVYEVDLVLARQGLALAAKVRTWRSAGRKVYDLKSPVVAS